MKRAMMVLSLVMIGGLAWRALRQDAPNPKLLYDRFWVDHQPRNDREQFQGLFFVGEHPFGNFSTRTTWEGRWVGFHYHVVPREDGVLDVIFPSTNERQRLTYSARRCNENGFDYCLELSGASRGARRYYSRKEWGDKSEASAAARVLPPTADQ